MKKDRTATLSRAPHLGDNVHRVTANFHYANMRCAQSAARSLSAQHSAHIVLGALTGIPWDQVTQVAAVRDSYYLLAAAHRSAGRKRERVENRAMAWADFRQAPARYTRNTVRAWARSIRQAVSA